MYGRGILSGGRGTEWSIGLPQRTSGSASSRWVGIQIWAETADHGCAIINVEIPATPFEPPDRSTPGLSAFIGVHRRPNIFPPVQREYENPTWAADERR
jgi:hypothetical protein